jgi:hypothetical protein
MSVLVAIVVYTLLAVAVLTMLGVFALVAGEIIEDVRSRMPASWHDRRHERLRVERACRQMELVRRDTIAEMERVVRECR